MLGFGDVCGLDYSVTCGLRRFWDAVDLAMVNAADGEEVGDLGVFPVGAIEDVMYITGAEAAVWDLAERVEEELALPEIAPELGFQEFGVCVASRDWRVIAPRLFCGFVHGMSRCGFCLWGLSLPLNPMARLRGLGRDVANSRSSWRVWASMKSFAEKSGGSGGGVYGMSITHVRVVCNFTH